MPTIRTLGTIIRVAARTLKALATGIVLLARFLGQGMLALRRRGAGGEPGMVRLLDLHAASCAGDTLVAMGLAGTVFFTVPVGEARGRVALYLLVTMLPFVLLAPVIGPLLDRVRHGRRYALAATMLFRAVLAYVIAERAGGFLMYPAAFGILVMSRAYGVARSAVVPRLVPQDLGLSEANARASVFGTLAGAIAVPAGLAAGYVGSRGTLLVAVGVFSLGTVAALRLPPRADADAPESVPRVLRRREKGRVKVLSGRVVVSTIVGSAALRSMYGFLTLYLAFAIRSDAFPDRLLGWRLSQAGALAVVAGALAAGSFLATAAGTVMRLRRPVLVQAWGALAMAMIAMVAALRQTPLTAAALCLVTAIASGLAKLTVDAVVQERVPEQVRASAFAHSETLLMTAWVLGAAAGLVPLAPRWGLLAVAAVATLSAGRAVVAAFGLRAERLSGSAVSKGDGTTGSAAEDSQRQLMPARAVAEAERAATSLQAAGPGDVARPRSGRGGAGGGRWGRRRQSIQAPTRQADSNPASTRQAEPPQQDASAVQPPLRRLPTWVDSNDIGHDDLDDTKTSSPGFHLYRPSGMTGASGLDGQDDAG